MRSRGQWRRRQGVSSEYEMKVRRPAWVVRRAHHDSYRRSVPAQPQRDHPGRAGRHCWGRCISLGSWPGSPPRIATAPPRRHHGMCLYHASQKSLLHVRADLVPTADPAIDPPCPSKRRRHGCTRSRPPWCHGNVGSSRSPQTAASSATCSSWPFTTRRLSCIAPARAFRHRRHMCWTSACAQRGAPSRSVPWPCRGVWSSRSSPDGLALLEYSWPASHSCTAHGE
jgi:hypothetical protein